MKTYKLYIVMGLLFLCACDKKEFLNVKPDAAMTIPDKIEHLQALLDNDGRMNGALGITPWYPGMLEIGTDDNYYLDSDVENKLTDPIRKIYTWQSNPYPGIDVDAWNDSYSIIFNCNFILERLRAIPMKATEKAAYDHVHGSALFYRSFAYYALLSIFAPVYNPDAEMDSAAIPIRVSSDVTDPLRMGTMEDLYALIIDDLRQCIPLLPEEPLYKTRPSKRAGFALLSRIFLAKSDFENAYNYADSALRINADLLDYNKYPTTVNYPFPRFNDEVIFHCSMKSIKDAVTYISPELINSYSSNDLRLMLYYKKASAQNAYRFYGNYDGSLSYFVGLANNEVLLNRAEAAARIDRISEAQDDINRLMTHRCKKINGVSTYQPMGSISKSDLIEFILDERRKELVWRGIRWQDLKRLNLQADYQKTLYRTVAGIQYTLLPNSDNYVYPFPSNVTVKK